MKIMFIGAATSNHTMRWVNALSERGHDVLLVSRRDQVDTKKHISDQVKIIYLNHGGKFGYYLNVPQLKKIYKRFDPDVVNAHYASGYGLLSRLAKVHPLIISCWGSDVYTFPYQSKFNYKTLVKNFKYADAIASTSVAMANQVKLILNDEKQEIAVTPFGVDIKKFAPVLREKSDCITIGIVKYMEPIYDIPLLIRAYNIVTKKANVKTQLHIYGGGTLLDEMKKLVSDLGLETVVTFFGTIPNYAVPAAINSMDIFVNCSKQESFGVALVEAMACEVPVVATDTEGFQEVVDNGRTGIILKDREPETMADALLQLIKDENMRINYGKAGRARVIEKYNWDENVNTMINLYLSVQRNS